MLARYLCLMLFFVNAYALAETPLLQMASLEACRYDDVLTPLQAFEAWPYTLLDPIYRLEASYEPPDLLSLAEAGFPKDLTKDLAREFRLRALVMDDLKELMSAAKAAGNPIALQSAYRSYGYQEKTFDYWVKLQGYEAALRSSARPGHSEHQLGTAIDFRSEGGPAPWDLADWAQSPAGAWMKENAWRYGFVMSYPDYPESQRILSCYDYEPWHYRYVGREVARAIQESGLSLRAWLWVYQGAYQGAY
ncbi:MAG: M15 family metallopeptidase [Deinococcales bacterium]